MQQDAPQLSETCKCLRAAIIDEQSTIRAFDLKASFLAAFLAAVVGIAQGLKKPHAPGLLLALAVIAIVTAAASIAMTGLVLIPRKKKRAEINLGGYAPQNVFHPLTTDESTVNVATFAARASRTDWVSELTFELFKIGRIRAEKEKHFRAAIVWAGISFASGGVSLLWSMVEQS